MCHRQADRTAAHAAFQRVSSTPAGAVASGETPYVDLQAAAPDFLAGDARELFERLEAQGWF